MDREFWLERWRMKQTGFHLSQVNPRLSQWAERALPAANGSRVLLPLCGKSLDLAWLADRGHRVVGVELSPIAARAFFEARGQAPEVTPHGPFERYAHGAIEILCGDFFALTPDLLGACDGFYDRASVVALPESMRDRYVATLASVLPSATRGLLVTFDYPQAEMSGPPFSVPEPEVHARYDAAFEVERLASYDILAKERRFAERGMTRLHEHVFALLRR